MNTSYSFLDLFSADIAINAETKGKVGNVVIPMIQRPYAQGRPDPRSTSVRDTFLNQIFESLEKGETLDLNFIYGNVAATSSEGCRFEVLDGQQRLTTLYLLYWYIASAELKEEDEEDKRVRECLSRFSYETRASSTLFCSKLAGFRPDKNRMESKEPSKVIRNAKWYYGSFDRDGTIPAMLTMLDAIHERYKKSESRGRLYHNLDKIRFIVQSIGAYRLSEELYVKMNARGLHLTPFENFKADLIDWIARAERDGRLGERGGSVLPMSLEFGIKLDTKWNKLFWDSEHPDRFDPAYLHFFTNYFASKYIIYSEKEVTDKAMQKDTVAGALFTKPNSAGGLSENISFKPVAEILNKHPECIRELDRTLDALVSHEELVDSPFTPVWESKRVVPFYKSYNGITQSQFVVFSAVVEYLGRRFGFDETKFMQWMRVVWNVVENTNIDSLTPTSSLIRKFAELASRLDRKEEKDFYTLLLSRYSDDNMEAFKAEAEKARRITEDPAWEKTWIEYEKHPFFKGLVTFFYDPGWTREEYERHAKNASHMFDESGVSQEMRVNEHVLLRGIISRIKEWKDLNEKYLTEKAETNKYLKILLGASDDVRKMFADVTGCAHPNETVKRLKEYIYRDSSEPFDSSFAPEAYPLFRERLLGSPKIFDWVSEKEKEGKKCFRAYNKNGHFSLAIPNKWYDRVALDTERARMAYELYSHDGFKYDDEKQLEMYKKYEESNGSEIRLEKESAGCRIRVGFTMSHQTKIELIFPTEERRIEALRKVLREQGMDSTTSKEEPAKLTIEGPKHYRYKDTYPSLKDCLDKIDTALRVSPSPPETKQAKQAEG